MGRAHQTGVGLGGFRSSLAPSAVSRGVVGGGQAAAPARGRGRLERRPRRAETRVRRGRGIFARWRHLGSTRSRVDEGRALDVRARRSDARGRGRVSPMESRMFARAKVRRMSRRAGARAWAVRAGAVFDPFVPRKESIIRNPALFPREFDPRTSEIRKAPTRFHRGFAGGDRSATRRERARDGIRAREF